MKGFFEFHSKSFSRNIFHIYTCLSEYKYSKDLLLDHSRFFLRLASTGELILKNEKKKQCTCTLRMNLLKNIYLMMMHVCLFILFLRILSTVLIIYVSLVTENQQFGNYLN